MEYLNNNLENSKNYFYVKRKIYKTYINFKFYYSDLEELNLLLFNLSDDNLFLDVNVNKFLKNNIKFNLNNNSLKLKYKNKTWILNNEEKDTKTIIKKCLRKNINGGIITSYDMINIGNVKNNNFKKIVEKDNSSIIDSFKRNKLFFFKGIIDNNKNYFDSDTCVICLEEFKNDKNNLINLGCKHRFHTQCLKDWIKHNKKCPICRQKISIRNILEKNKVNIFTSTSPKFRNETPTLSFSPIENGLASSKNIKLEFNLESVYKSIKLTKDIFGIEFSDPLKFEDSISLTLVNLSLNRAKKF